MSLSTSELSMLRTAQGQYLSGTAIVQRATSGHNVIGEGTISWAAVATADCRVAPISMQSRLQAVGDQQQTVASWVVTLPYDTDAQAGDRLVIASDTYEVIQAWTDGTYKTAVRCDCRRMDS